MDKRTYFCFIEMNPGTTAGGPKLLIFNSLGKKYEKINKAIDEIYRNLCDAVFQGKRPSTSVLETKTFSDTV